MKTEWTKIGRVVVLCTILLLLVASEAGRDYQLMAFAIFIDYVVMGWMLTMIIKLRKRRHVGLMVRQCVEKMRRIVMARMSTKIGHVVVLYIILLFLLASEVVWIVN